MAISSACRALTFDVIERLPTARGNSDGRNLGVRCASKVLCVAQYDNCLCVGNWEVMGYESRLNEISSPHGDLSLASVSADSIESVKLMTWFDTLWFMKGHEYWVQDLDT